jgi:hypothetical protein
MAANTTQCDGMHGLDHHIEILELQHFRLNYYSEQKKTFTEYCDKNSLHYTQNLLQDHPSPHDISSRTCNRR